MSQNNNQKPAAAQQQGAQKHLLDNYTVPPQNNGGNEEKNPFYKSAAPSISLPKGGGALKGIDEKFSVNAINGTAGLSVPLPLTPGRGGFTPSLAISYNSGGGNSEFGLGWGLGLPSIQRKTDKQLPLYNDVNESDVFLLAGAEDLIPKLNANGDPDEFISPDNYFVKRYIPRIEGLFARIEFIKNLQGNTWWRVTTKDNITTWYGCTANARLAAPDDARKVFKWLPELVIDGKGNVQQYIYKPENLDRVPAALHERNRCNNNCAFTNLYLKRVRYANLDPYTVEDADQYQPILPTDSAVFLMEAVLDYGEHDGPGDIPVYEPIDPVLNQWQARTDPFSDFHAGFEIRTFRRCHKVLMFHRFSELNGGVPTLVRSLDLAYENGIYNEAAPYTEADFINSITQTGYQLQGSTWLKDSLPAMEMVYQPLEWNDELKNVSPADTKNAPQGLTGPYQWIDLWGEGLPSILSDQGQNWWYKSNLGDGHFSPAQPIAEKPSFAGLASGSLQWQDLDADGRRQVVSRNRGTEGFFELDDALYNPNDPAPFDALKGQQWKSFQAFKEKANVDWNSPYTKMLDLNGDGRPDILLTHERVWTWYENEGKTGFAEGGQVSTVFDEEKGPRLVLNDKVQSIYLADMNGDGMTDIVRIKNGEVCYWPNMGYGKFGAKVAMTNAPTFDHPDLFNPIYLQLTDISGTGAADLVYLGANTFRAWINLSGNAFSEAHDIATLPGIEPYSKVALLDFLGNGTGCIVWSSPLPQHSHAPMRYIDLMGGKKPYLMHTYHNGMGKSVNVTYKSSTQFYLADKAAGTPWATLLPFPVQCIDKISTHDAVSDTTYSQTYAYHHGYYDHEEREFRGFGRVDVLDIDKARLVDNDDPAVDVYLDQAPVLTKTWYHTGAWIRERTLLEAFKAEYYSSVEFTEPATQATIETGLNPQEQREAYRALKGSALRQEVYALDGDEDKESIPYTVTTNCYAVKLIQPSATVTSPVGGSWMGAYASFLTYSDQSLSWSCERQPDDARLSQTLTLLVDKYGNPLETVAIAYPRRAGHLPGLTMTADQQKLDAVWKAQRKMHITYTTSAYTEDIGTADLDKNPPIEPEEFVYRLRVPYKSSSYELSLHKSDYLADGDLWTAVTIADMIPDEMDAIDFSAPFAIDETPTAYHVPELKLLSRNISLFAKDANLAMPEDESKLTKLAIPYESYTLAFTPDLFIDCFGTTLNAGSLLGENLTDPNLSGGYVHYDGDDNWWIPSGTVQYGNSPEGRFYSPVSFTDPWGNETHIEYWEDYYLLPEAVTDAKANITSVTEYDWRTLQPVQMMDANENISGICYDILGMPVATAIMGKGTEADYLWVLGATDPMDPETWINPSSTTDLAAQVAFWNATTPSAIDAAAKTLLGKATWRCIYNLHTQPTAVAMIAREQHYADNPTSDVIIRVSYTDGFGRVAMHKAQCAPHVMVSPPNHVGEEANWIGSGKTIYNNKGKEVMQFEPYFSTSHQFDSTEAAEAVGVSPRIFYDPLGRPYRTEMPDGTYSFTEWDNWKQVVYDANDTTKIDGVKSAWYDAMDGGTVEEQQAAEKALAHANTPTVMHLDTLARPFFTVQILEPGTTLAEPVEAIRSYANLDILGNRISIVDGLRITTDSTADPFTLQYKYNMLKAPCWQHSIDGGEGRMIVDAAGQPLYHWDADERFFSTVYDALRRPLQQKVTKDSVTKVLERIEYGEDFGLMPGNDVIANMRGRVAKTYDGAGLVSVDYYNFKGEPHITTRRFTENKTEHPNWITISSVALETYDDPGSSFPLPLNYETRVLTDALGRPISIRNPDYSLTTNTYDKGGMLYSLAVDNVQTLDTDIVNTIAYDAKGQRTKVQYENGTTTTYEYDPLTYRVTRIRTTRHQDGKVLQDLLYWYDAVGNITLQKDDALQTVFYANNVADPKNDYTYDALYRLVKVCGRELVGNNSAVTNNDASRSLKDAMPFINNSIDPANAAAMRRYAQYYEYDAVGNMVSMRHTTTGGTNTWTRNFTTSSTSNRLTGSSIGSNGSSSETYTYDGRGNMTSGMNHLNAGGASMTYNAMNRLEKVTIDSNTTAYYQYDGGGQRVRKTIVNTTASITETRKYVGSWEVYTKNVNGTDTLQRETLHVADDTGRIALIDTPTKDTLSTGELQLLRYQYSNHLGTATLELDDDAAIISYEEYYPYGSTSFQSGRSAAEVSLKRYRYTGKERDEETGLNYHGARYYAPWLCRWVAVDPLESEYAPQSSFVYCSNSPVMRVDPSGMGDDGNEKPKVGHQSAIQIIGKDGNPIPSGVTDKYQMWHTNEGPYNQGEATITTGIQPGGTPAEGGAAMVTTTYTYAYGFGESADKLRIIGIDSVYRHSDSLIPLTPAPVHLLDVPQQDNNVILTKYPIDVFRFGEKITYKETFNTSRVTTDLQKTQFKGDTALFADPAAAERTISGYAASVKASGTSNVDIKVTTIYGLNDQVGFNNTTNYTGAQLLNDRAGAVVRMFAKYGITVKNQDKKPHAIDFVVSAKATMRSTKSTGTDVFKMPVKQKINATGRGIGPIQNVPGARLQKTGHIPVGGSVPRDTVIWR